jgi:ABC-2 type transport system ATP-binding protein
MPHHDPDPEPAPGPRHGLPEPPEPDVDSGVPERTVELPVGPVELIRTQRLGLRTRRGWVFRNFDLVAPAGSVTALAGPAGSGRSMLLLTLAGRARPTDGELTVGGTKRRADLRRLVAVARVTAAVELEPEMTVIDHVREADLLTRGHFDYRWAAGIVGLDVDPTAVVADLATDDATLLAVALALATRPKALTSRLARMSWRGSGPRCARSVRPASP